MSAIRAVFRVGLYPGFVIGALLLLWALLTAGVPLAWAPYLTIAVIGPLVLVAERLLPFRAAWSPTGADFVQDGLYVVFVQILVPLGLGWAAALLLQRVLQSAGLVLTVWPSDWPILAQLALKVIAGDLLRYWLHRLAHTWSPLWRLHSVHHHPGKLYSTNVFRFHPAEKALQFLADTAPFLLLGIGVEALGYYFVFYAVSGLLQHANIDVRLGWLNYLVSGPEVHRWHHSKVIAESNNNYAHSFVVWDLVFGTYFRPKERLVGDLGLLDASYPQGFWRQLGAPFRRSASTSPASPPSALSPSASATDASA